MKSSQKTRAALREEAALKEQRRIERQRRWAARWTLMKRSVQIFLVVLIVGAFCWIFRDRIFITVDSGEVLVVFYRFFGGTSHNAIGHEGLHIIAPWDRGYKYVVRSQTLVVPMTVMSKNGLDVHLDAQIRFHPIAETIPYMHRRYGPDYIKTEVVPQLTEAVQRVIGQFLPEEVYSSSTGASANRLFESAKRLVGGVFIEVEDIALFNIKLPEKVQAAIQQKAEAEQAAQAYAFRVQQEELEFKRRQKEIEGLKLYADMAQGIPKSILIWKGIEATLELAKSPNAKVIVMGGRDNLPLMLGNVPDLTEK